MIHLNGYYINENISIGSSSIGNKLQTYNPKWFKLLVVKYYHDWNKENYSCYHLHASPAIHVTVLAHKSNNFTLL